MRFERNKIKEIHHLTPRLIKSKNLVLLKSIIDQRSRHKAKVQGRILDLSPTL